MTLTAFSAALSSLARRLAPIGLPLLLVLLVGLAYHASPKNGFHLDDAINIVRHGPVHMHNLDVESLRRGALEGHVANRILPNLSFAIDWWRGGGSATAFQQTNLLIHVLTALAVFALLQKILRLSGSSLREAHIVAFLASAVWALHPIQVQAVTYIVQRMAALSALFMLIALLSYLNCRTSPRRLPWVAATLSASLAALLSKENAAILPLLFLLAEFTLVRPAPRPFTLIDKLLLAIPVIGGAYLLADLLLFKGPFFDFISAGYANREFTLSERLLTQPRVIFFHLGQILFPLPSRFSIEHDFLTSSSLLNPAGTLPALAGIGVAVAVGVWATVRQPTATAGFFVLWLPLTLSIESSVIALEMLFEHRMYLPSVGLAGLMALALRHAFRMGTQRAAMIGALIVIALLTTATLLRVPAWRTSTTLYEHAVRTAPSSPRAWTNLATAYIAEGRRTEALTAYDRALSLDSRYAVAYLNRASALRQDGKFDAAAADYRRFIELRPDDFRGPYAYGALLHEAGELQAAIDWLQRASLLAPFSALPYKQLATAYLDTGAPAAAIAALRKAGQHDSALVDAEYFELLGLAQAHLGEFDSAADAFKRALDLEPERNETRVNLGFAQLRRRAPNQALTTFDDALRRDPTQIRAYVGRGEALIQLGRLREAVETARRGLSLAPDTPRLTQLLEDAAALTPPDESR